ncbi:MAG: type II secretion system protein N [Janthinobacterium lividum]
MTRLQFRLATFALFAVFCVTLTYWVVTLSTVRSTIPVGAAAASSNPVSIAAAGRLFGGRDMGRDQSVHLSGILSLGDGRGAAAIVSFAGEPSRTVTLGQSISDNAVLTQVRARSIVIDRHGTHSEVFLPSNVQGPTIYMH